jgi:hypothetical protein
MMSNADNMDALNVQGGDMVVGKKEECHCLRGRGKEEGNDAGKIRVRGCLRETR